MALSLGLLQPDVIWYSVSLKPGLSSLMDFPFLSAAIRPPAFCRLNVRSHFCKDFMQFLLSLHQKKRVPFGEHSLFLRLYILCQFLPQDKWERTFDVICFRDSLQREMLSLGNFRRLEPTFRQWIGRQEEF